MDTPKLPCDALLLAAGAGSRLGTPKALLELNGVWMLPRLCEALLQGGCRSVYVLLRPQEESLVQSRGGCGADKILLHAVPGMERTGTILTGLKALPPGDAVMIHPCDVPLLCADAVAQLLRGWRRSAEARHQLARLVTPGGKGGHPLLLGAQQVEKLRCFPAEKSLRDLVHQNPTAILNLVRRGDPGPFLDVDTPEQLALLESLL